MNTNDIYMLSQGYTTLVVFSILLASFKLSVVFPTCLESFEKQGTNAFLTVIFQVAVYILSKHQTTVSVMTPAYFSYFIPTPVTPKFFTIPPKCFVRGKENKYLGMDSYLAE